MRTTRRTFLTTTSIAIATALPAASQQPNVSQTPPNNTPPARRAEPLSEELVHEWVWRGHFDLDGVKRMLAVHPTLLNSSYDWDHGDFEMAIGGAGHMGRRDIAEYLLSQGGRMDIFVATMLGRLDIVKATLTAYPALLQGRGPHGLTFLHHARQGGDAAREVLEYLQSLGAK